MLQLRESQNRLAVYIVDGQAGLHILHMFRELFRRANAIHGKGYRVRLNRIHIFRSPGWH